MLKEIAKLANDLDFRGLTKEADYLDALVVKIANKPPLQHYIEESYDIGNDYKQVRLSNGEQYIFDKKDLPDLNTPGSAISNEEFLEAKNSGLLLGDGSYDGTSHAKDAAGLNSPPEGAIWISSFTQHGKTKCYYRLNNEYFETYPASGDCTNQGGS